MTKFFGRSEEIQGMDPLKRNSPNFLRKRICLSLIYVSSFTRGQI